MLRSRSIISASVGFAALTFNVWCKSSGTFLICIIFDMR